MCAQSPIHSPRARGATSYRPNPAPNERTVPFQWRDSVAKGATVSRIRVDLFTVTRLPDKISRATLDSIVENRTPRDSSEHSVCVCIRAKRGRRVLSLHDRSQNRPSLPLHPLSPLFSLSSLFLLSLFSLFFSLLPSLPPLSLPFPSSFGKDARTSRKK